MAIPQKKTVGNLIAKAAATLQYPKTTGELVSVKDSADGQIKLLDSVIQLLRTADTDISATVETLSGKLNLDRCPIGASMWWWGTIANIPTGWIIMDGSSLPVATYPELYAIIGTAYGGDATNFNVPDLITERRFIRADNVAGEEEIDTIRNIKGELQLFPNENYGFRSIINDYSGAFYGYLSSTQTTQCLDSRGGGQPYSTGIEFDANANGSASTNPIFGHADGDDIHPYNISAIPIMKVA